MRNSFYSYLLKLTVLLAVMMMFPDILSGDISDDDSNSFSSPIHLAIARADSLLNGRKLEAGTILIDSIMANAREELPPDDTTLAYALNVLGKAAYFASDYKKCRNAWMESYDIRRKNLGLDHALTAASLNNLGALVKTVGEFHRAESLYTEVLAIRKRIQPPDHPDFAGLYTNLGSLKRITGQFAEAESLYHLAYDINLKTVGEKHPVTAGCMNNIGVLYEEQGRYEQAGEFYRKALDSYMETLGEKHPQTASSLNNLGNLYYNMHNYNAAESLYTLALNIRRELYGEDHLALASSYNNLAIVSMETGDFVGAESYYNKALLIKSSKLPAGHPLLASSYDNLGIVYYYMSEYKKSEEMLLISQDIYNKTYGDFHPYSTSNLTNIAKLYAAMGKYPEAFDTFSRVFDSRQKFIREVFAYAGEANKLKYLHKYPLIDNALLSLAVKLNSADMNELAFRMILEGKAAVIDAICAEKQIVFSQPTPEAENQFEIWRDACTRLSTVALSGIDYLRTDIYKHKVDSLFAVKDSMELLLSKNYAEFGDKTAGDNVDLDDLASALLENEALWEFVKYDYYDFDKPGSDTDRTGEPKYLAVVYDNREKLRVVDLGSSDIIDGAVEKIRQNIYDADQYIFSFGEQAAEKMFLEGANELYGILINPLISIAPEFSTIIISPDGELNLIPFEILAADDDHYLIENYDLKYVSSGRDILTFGDFQNNITDILILADPKYDCRISGIDKERNKFTENASASDSRGSRTNNGCNLRNFTPLPYTGVEAREIVNLLEKLKIENVRYFSDDDASETVLKEYALSPQVLHLATHGFFCEARTDNNQSLIQNPLLRSGLALADANCINELSYDRLRTLGEDGILTAFEASGLDLSQTRLVVLSACETGLGEVQSGEGVFGLRRAFQYAGSGAILMSLWKVDEAETSDLMSGFYENWLSGNSKSKSFRKAALDIMNKRRDNSGCAHPYYWGGFVLLGNPN